MSLQHMVLVLLCFVFVFRDQLSLDVCFLQLMQFSMLSLLVHLVYDHCHLDV